MDPRSQSTLLACLVGLFFLGLIAWAEWQATEPTPIFGFN